MNERCVRNEDYTINEGCVRNERCVKSRDA